MRARRFIEVTAGALVAAGLSMASTSSQAVSSYLTAFNARYPTSTTGTTSWSTSGGRCNICHSTGGGTDFNAYGAAFAIQLSNGVATAAAIQAIEAPNSDASAVSNLAEITANAQPGWKPGATNTFYDFGTANNGSLLVAATGQNPPSTLIGAADPAAPPTTTTTTAPPTTTTTTAPPTTTTTTAPPTTTTTTAPPTTTTTTASPTTTTTTAPPTTTTTAPPTTTTTTAPPTTTTTTTTTTTRATTTTTASTTTTTLASGGAALYNSFCASCHDGAAASGGGRNVLGARTCSINGAINGTSVFPGGVPAMQFLKGILSATQIQAISSYLNSGTVTGQQRYITTCAGCHGADARGGRTGENVRGASAGDIREAIDDEREMRFLRCLPRSDTNAIGTYLRGIRSGSGDSEHDDD